jgi:inhibitor of cysteine peptidase
MKFMLAFGICLLLAGCATTPSFQTLTERDNGRHISVPVGEVLVVQLPGNPTTGFSWQARTAADSVLESMGEPTYIQNPARLGMTGVGGTESWQFKAVKAGSETLRLEYVRSWETNTAPAKVITFDLVVRS